MRSLRSFFLFLLISTAATFMLLISMSFMLAEEQPDYLGIIKDQYYKDHITKDKKTLEALSFFNGYDCSDILLSNKVSAESIEKLYEILKGKSAETVQDYIYNSVEHKNSNSIALILQSNLLDWDVAMSAYICRSFNIPYIIISNRDGSFVNTSGNMLKLSLEREDNTKKINSPIYYLLAPVYRELDFARKYGDTYRVKTDLAKEEILQVLEDLVNSYDSVYFFINTHAGGSLAIYSSAGLEYINASDIYERLNKVKDPVTFKIIAGHCYDIVEDELEQKLKSHEYVEYSFLSASSVKAWEGDLLETLIFADDGIITIDELNAVCSGQGSDHTTVSQEGERFYIFKQETPPYLMDICYAGRGYCDYVLRSNSDDMSIFYYRVKYFK